MKNKSLSFKIILSILILMLLGGLIFLGYYLLKKDFKIKNYKKEIILNYKETYKDEKIDVCYGNYFSCKKVYSSKMGTVNTNKLGTYKITYIYEYKNEKIVLNQKVKVKDIKKPKILLKETQAIVCPNGKISKLDFQVKDNYDKDLSRNIKTTYIKEKNIVLIEVKDSSNNVSTKTINAKILDNEAPKITLNGSENIYVYVGGTYTDEGAKVKDNCDDVKIETTNDINYSAAGTYHITYTSIDSSNNKSETKRNIIVKNKNSGKRVIYLTFDDGPSVHTNRLLDILKKYNVKVTFFVTGNGDDSIILREYQEGHKIALHTNSHNYAYVYSSVNNYFNDLNTISQKVENITGYKPNLIRFPGGSSNTVSKAYSKGIMSTLTKEVENRGYKYFDWNVSSGDAGGTTTSDGVFMNVVSTLKEDSFVVLQHDTQGFSVDATERIIIYGLQNGYTFETLDENSPGAHHGVNN